jgi:hypothetical protein
MTNKRLVYVPVTATIFRVPIGIVRAAKGEMTGAGEKFCEYCEVLRAEPPPNLGLLHHDGPVFEQHRNVIEAEATKEESKSKLRIFWDSFRRATHLSS